MKSFIAILLLLAALPLRAQITLEHTYHNFARDFGLVRIDSNEWKYVRSFRDTIEIYNLDHTLDRVILIPWAPPYQNGYASLLIIAKGLFANDASYCYLTGCPDASGEFSGLKIFKENGSLLFSRDSAYLGTNNDPNIASLNNYPPSAIKTASNGTKMIITASVKDNGITGPNVEVYSLPGRLPGSSQMMSVNPNGQSNWPQLESSVYPNPSQGRVRIAYDLPAGITSGEIVLTNVSGAEVKRYHITNAFNDLLIEEGDLPSGSYFYKVVTTRGESAAQRIVREK